MPRTKTATATAAGEEKEEETAANTSGMISLELNELEQYFCSMSELPVATLTWFRGDYRSVVEALKDRTKSTLEQNLWLTGKVKGQPGQMAIEYSNDPQSFDLWDYFCVVEENKSPLSRDTPLSKIAGTLYSSNFEHDGVDSILMLSNGPEEPLFRFLVIPCKTNPQEHFGIVLIVSHLIADGATYYRIHEMICNKDCDIVPLIADRIPNSISQQREAMGEEEYKYMSSAGNLWNWKCNMFRANHLSTDKMEEHFALVDPNKMQQAKKDALLPAETNGTKGSSNGRKDCVSFVSTNDVLTSWFFQHTECPQGQMCINFRGRLEGHGEDHAGNYENILFYRLEDSSTPVHIRQSLSKLGRERSSKLPGFWERVTTDIAMVTNWSSFGSPCVVEGADEEMHLPIYDFDGAIPYTYALLIIFRAGPKGIGLYYGGRSELLKGLRSAAPFLSEVELK